MCSCNVELTDPLYRSEGFMMFCYKILPCKKSFRHDWRVCPFAHGDETAKRRDPRIFKYTGVICPDAKKGRSCPRGDDCPCTHSLFEYWLHPTRFKTEICSRGSRCNRPFCFFAHKQSEIRKPNFRVQMQGITCDPTHHQPSLHPDSRSLLMSHCMNSTSRVPPSMKKAPFTERTPMHLFPSAALSTLSLEGSSISAPDSGSSCDAELPAANWNSWMGSDSPRFETPMQPQSMHPGCISQSTFSSGSVYPLLPQIPTSEHNAVDWSMRQPPASKQQVSSAQSSIGHDSIWNPGKLSSQTSIGMSPRLMDPTRNVAKSLKGPTTFSHSTTDNGYDRDYLLATIRDVYQSMLSGCSNEQQSVMPTTSECQDAQTQQHHASFGLTGLVGGGYYGTNGACGLEGLQQQNGCVSSNGVSYTTNNTANDPNAFERMMYALLKTDINSATRYFK